MGATGPLFVRLIPKGDAPYVRVSGVIRSAELIVRRISRFSRYVSAVFGKRIMTVAMIVPVSRRFFVGLWHRSGIFVNEAPKEQGISVPRIFDPVQATWEEAWSHDGSRRSILYQGSSPVVCCGGVDRERFRINHWERRRNMSIFRPFPFSSVAATMESL